MARGVMELLEEINRQGTTIIMVTHDPELAARAQRNVHIIDGQVTDFDDEPKLRTSGLGTRDSGLGAEVVALAKPTASSRSGRKRWRWFRSPMQEALGLEAFLKAICAVCIYSALLSNGGYQWVSPP